MRRPGTQTDAGSQRSRTEAGIDVDERSSQMFGPMSNPLAVRDVMDDRQSEGVRLAATYEHRAVPERQKAPDTTRQVRPGLIARILATAGLLRR